MKRHALNSFWCAWSFQQAEFDLVKLSWLRISEHSHLPWSTPAQQRHSGCRLPAKAAAPLPRVGFGGVTACHVMLRVLKWYWRCFGDVYQAFSRDDPCWYVKQWRLLTGPCLKQWFMEGLPLRSAVQFVLQRAKALWFAVSWLFWFGRRWWNLVHRYGVFSCGAVWWKSSLLLV